VAKARYLVEAHLLESRSVSELAAALACIAVGSTRPSRLTRVSPYEEARMNNVVRNYT
jgi:hypothetical protein